MAVLFKRTIGSRKLLIVDADPSAGGGVAASTGSKAFMSDGSAEYLKTGSGDTAWTMVTNPSNTQTLTNKRVTPRSDTTASSATPTINTDNLDYYSITALAAAITSMTTNLSGTPTRGQTFWLAITDNGVARAITWGTGWESSGYTSLPTTTVAGVRMDIQFVWNSATSKWRCVGIS